MKKILFLLLLSFFLLPLHGQIAVESFRLLEMDLTANTQGTQEIDQNGEVAALIKVVTTQKDFAFDNGMLGIVKVIPQPGEYWVYVPRRTQKITIRHSDLGVLRDYYFKIPIESGRTYELKLTTGQVITTVKKSNTTQYLTMHVTPANASVYIDNTLRPLNEEGELFLLLTVGSHNYRVEAVGYKSEAGVVNITSSEKNSLDINLTSVMATLTVNCQDPEADIVINEEVRGHGSWTGTLVPGIYVIEGRRENHRNSYEEVRLDESATQRVTLSPPTPIYGSLRVESKPMGATVYIDGTAYDDTPCLIDETQKVIIGEHRIELRKNGYKSFSTRVTLKEDEEFRLSNITLSPSALAHAPSLFKKTGFHADAYFQLGSPSAAGVALGAYLNNIHAELSFALPFAGAIPIYYTFVDDAGVFSRPVLQEYKAASLLGCSVGYGIPLGHRLRLTPSVGTDVLSVTAPEVEGGNKQQSYVFSGTVSLRTEIALTQLLSLYVSPAYSFVIQRGATVERLSTISSDLAGWNNGASLRAGISLNF